jgi:hypothetical protein
MFELPANLIAEVDQSKAHADRVCSTMVETLREDLQAGQDPGCLWYVYTGALIHGQDDPRKAAAVLISALLRLAAQDT